MPVVSSLILVLTGAICNRFRIRGKSAEKFLRDIVLFSIVKRRQIEKALEVLDLINKVTTIENLEKRKLLCEEIKTLNREGNVSG